MSLDGFTAGPDQSVASPPGVGGEGLFDGTGADLHGLELVRTVATPEVVHLRLSGLWRSERAEQAALLSRPHTPKTAGVSHAGVSHVLTLWLTPYMIDFVI